MKITRPAERTQPVGGGNVRLDEQVQDLRVHPGHLADVIGFYREAGGDNGGVQLVIADFLHGLGRLVGPLHVDIQVPLLGFVAEDVGQPVLVVQFHAGAELERFLGGTDEPKPEPRPAASEASARNGEYVAAHVFGNGNNGRRIGEFGHRMPHAGAGKIGYLTGRIYPQCGLACQDEPPAPAWGVSCKFAMYLKNVSRMLAKSAV